MDANELRSGEVVLRLTKSEALVLLEWIHRAEDGDIGLRTLPGADEAEARVLHDVSASLESVLAEPFLPEWADVLAEAKASVLGSPG
jgi:hypothetical protein